MSTGRDVIADEAVAIKLERMTIDPSFLKSENSIYEDLKGPAGFPRVYWYGSKDDFRVMVLQILGPNLQDLFRYCGRRFSLKTGLILMDQLLCRFQSLHSRGYVHRDVSPANFLLGVKRFGNTVYMTDLGLATSFRPEKEDDDSSSGRTMLPRKVVTVPSPIMVRKPNLIGTRDYTSVAGHLERCKFSTTFRICVIYR